MTSPSQSTGPAGLFDANPHPTPKPWQRLWARYLDYLYFGSITGVLSSAGLLYALSFIAEPGTLVFLGPLMLLITIPLSWVPCEACLLWLFGTTPGKWLFNITVRTQQNQHPSFLSALQRSVVVVMLGLGMGIPLLNLLTMLIQYVKLQNTHTTPWDNTTFNITHQPLSTGRLTTILILYLVFPIFIVTSLALLSVIAAFTIPKILDAKQSSAIFDSVLPFC